MEATRRKKRPHQGERGAALVSVVVVIAVMAVTTADFAFNTTMDLAAAANARDDLRAHFLARSGINLSKLLFRLQQRVIDPNRKFLGGMDLQVADYAPLLMSAFNSKEGAEMLGSLFGISSGEIKGIGVDVGTFDLELESFDGRINLNCGGGANPSSPSVVRMAAGLTAMMMAPRYNRLFEEPDSKGEYADRLEILRAIVDWVDQDTVMFGSSAVEDYRYNTGKDPYENKNQYLDTIDELYLVKGVEEDWMDAFRDAVTVYGGCKVNVNIATPTTIVALILQYAQSPTHQSMKWENIMLLSRYVVHLRDYFGGFKDAETFARAIADPMDVTLTAYKQGIGGLSTGTTGTSSSSTTSTSTAPTNVKAYESSLPGVIGVPIKKKPLMEAIVAGGPRRIYEIRSTAEVGHIKKKITAIWDMKLIPMSRTQAQAGPGGYLYWREE